MRIFSQILPIAQRWGGGPAKLVEGYSNLVSTAALQVLPTPSTILRMVPLPSFAREDLL